MVSRMDNVEGHPVLVPQKQRKDARSISGEFKNTWRNFFGVRFSDLIYWQIRRIRVSTRSEGEGFGADPTFKSVKDGSMLSITTQRILLWTRDLFHWCDCGYGADYRSPLQSIESEQFNACLSFFERRAIPTLWAPTWDLYLGHSDVYALKGIKVFHCIERVKSSVSSESYKA